MRHLTPSKISAWLECGHYLNLDRQLDAGSITIEHRGFGEFARLVMDKGQEHERACLEDYRRSGLSVVDTPGRRRGETFTDWIARLGDPLATDADVLYQVPLANDGMRGIADFLVRVVEDDETVTWEPVDAKLARTEAKPGHVMQLCFYAEAIAALTDRAPKNLHLWLGSGEMDHIPSATVMPYWRRLRAQLQTAMDELEDDADSVPIPCNHCSFCHFNGLCEKQWRGEDALHYVAGINRRDTVTLTENGIGTLAALASTEPSATGLGPERAEVLALQAQLQVEARNHSDDPPPVTLLAEGAGLALLPAPDDGDMFLDFEGHPFWRPDRGLFFLFGYVTQDEPGDWRYHAHWAHDEDGEATITQQLVDVIAERRDAHPGMHVYHYNHTERSSLDRLAAEHATHERLLGELIETGCFVDLLEVVRHSLRAGVESYGLKHLEVIAGYERDHAIDRGSGAVVEYEQHRADGDPARLERIERYNEDDVRATLALRDWLVDMRPDGLAWRPAVLEVEDLPEGFDEKVQRLLDTGTPEAELLAHVLGFWLREHRAHRAPLLAKSAKPLDDLLDDPLAITGLHFHDLMEPSGRERVGGAGFTFPDQELSSDFKNGSNVLFTTPEGFPSYSNVRRLEPPDLCLVWGEKHKDATPPKTVVIHEYFDPGPKVDALNELADAVVESTVGAHASVARSLLLRKLPRIRRGHRPAGGRFSEDLEASKEWVRHLDSSVLALQGPPGTGKTYRGSHIIKHLIDEGLRVGVTATSYAAMDNLVKAVTEVFEQAGDDGLHAIRKKSGKNPELEAHGVAFGDNAKCAKPEYNLVAGTSWLFASEAMLEHPVDVLVIDEAGQYALADALAALRSARNLLLLGDPLQLPHVSQAIHPQGSGASVLAHVLGDDRTMPDDRGIFLTETWRMHPDVCGFISDQIYEGKLTSEASCAVQDTEAGTGLRWLPVEHRGNQTESAEEATRIADEVERLLGMSWTNQKGEQQPLTRADVMVVAPYNDQVRLIRSTLDDRKAARGVRVGTVDKFQGQEAAVVLFSMTTSSYEDMPRGPEFLFSPNRLNVAISRARCLAYLVSTEEILNSRARNVNDMSMISNLCAFVERAT